MTAPVLTDPLDELRYEIEEAAADETVTPEERTARLRDLRERVVDLVGRIDTYIGDNRIGESDEEKQIEEALAFLRENADIREELLRREMTTEEALDEAGLISHEELDNLAEEELLLESAFSLMGAARAAYEERKHPRGRGGKWIAVMGKIDKLKSGDKHHVGNGVHVKNQGGEFHVQKKGTTLHKTRSSESAAKRALAHAEGSDSAPAASEVKSHDDVHAELKDARAKGGGEVHVGKGVKIKYAPNDGITDENKMTIHRDGKVLEERTDAGWENDLPNAARAAVRHAESGRTSETAKQGDWIRQSRRDAPATAEEKAAAASDTASRAAEQGKTPEEKKALYDARKQQLEQRVASKVTGAAERGKLSDAEAHFNDAGKVSQRTLGQYVDQASTKPQTIDLYSHVDPQTGERVWDASRKALHEKIITALLKKRVAHPETGKPVLDFSDTAEDLQPHPDGPQVLFSGGGYAAGKGGVLKILGAKGELPPDSFTLDPDQIKAELPEFQAMIGTDPEANMHTYQEAWAIAQEVQARAQEKSLNIVVDGISDTSPDEMIERARSFTSRGYQAKAVYVNIPTEEALKRAANRAETAKDDSDRRMIPEIIMRSVHRDVSATVPSLLTVLQHRQDVPLDLEVWDNNQGKDDAGSFRPPKQFVDFKGGTMQVLDDGLWGDFVAKGHEQILGVDAAGRSGETA